MEPLTVLGLVAGVSAAAGTAWIRASRRATVRRANAMRALAARLGGAYVTGFASRVVATRRHVVVRASMTSARARWALAAAPAFVLARPGSHRLPSGHRPMTVGDAEFDARFEIFIEVGRSTGVMADALSPAVRRELMALAGASLTSERGELTLAWSNPTLDADRAFAGVELLARIVRTGLAPLEAAERVPGVTLRQPDGEVDERRSAEVWLEWGATLGRLHHRDGRWRLEGPRGDRWPLFRGTVEDGRPVGTWPAPVLRDLSFSLEPLGDAEVIAEAATLRVVYARAPDTHALGAGLQLLARALAPPSEGAFR